MTMDGMHNTNNNNKELTDDERKRLEAQNSRLISEWKANSLEVNAKKNWDLFYKRNDTRFFKDRHWTPREFHEILSSCGDGVDNEENDCVFITNKEGQQQLSNQNDQQQNNTTINDNKKTMLEIGCGVGNLIFPLIKDSPGYSNKYFIYACDFSTNAIQLVKSNPLYNEMNMKVFQCDITQTSDVFQEIPRNSIDIITLVFVLSAINPDKFKIVIKNIYSLLKPNDGLLLFRDYGLYDMAQLRFKAGNKISENFYMRQDGTRSYYFSQTEVANLMQSEGFEILTNEYIYRRTVNVKEGVDVPRIFIQGKYRVKKRE